MSSLYAENRPFEIELLLGGGHVVPAKLWPDGLRANRNPSVAGAASDGTREAARGAAVMVVRNALLKNRDKPIEIEDGDTLWIIPTGSVMAARFRDPAVESGEKSYGFSPDRLGGEPE